MKTILKICCIGAFLFVCMCHAQPREGPVNYLTLAAYEAITINGVNWECIPSDDINTHYDIHDIIHQMEKHFGKHSFSITKGTEPSLYIDFWNSVIYFHFEDVMDTGNNYGLVRLRVKENTWNITIKGTTLTIGDPIGKLGKVKTLANDDGTKTVFFDCETCEAEGWSIDFDSNDRVKEIRYTVFD